LRRPRGWTERSTMTYETLRLRIIAWDALCFEHPGWLEEVVHEMRDLSDPPDPDLSVWTMDIADLLAVALSRNGDLVLGFYPHAPSVVMSVRHDPLDEQSQFNFFRLSPDTGRRLVDKRNSRGLANALARLCPEETRASADPTPPPRFGLVLGDKED
jgi:hypothetical protein